MGSGDKSTLWAGSREPADGETETWEPPSRFAAYIPYVVLLGYLAKVVLTTSTAGARATHMITCVLCCSVLFALQSLHTQPRWVARPVRYRAATLSAQALLTYLPLPWLGDSWEVAADFLVASVLLLLPARLKWQAFFAVVAANSLLAGLRHHGPALIVSITSATLVTGLALYSVSRMDFLESELRRARAGLGYAIWQERQRFARDLHDLLGYSLSAITLKTEVAIRHVPHRHEQVKEELTSILDVSRQALSEVRHVAHSYRSLSLTTELEACVALLRCASIEVDVRTSVRPPEGRSGRVLAIVLREAVTNMLQHSKVQSCALGLDRVGGRLRLSIVNNGTGLEGRHDDLSSSSSAGGRGLTNLEIRLAEVGGTLTVGRRSGGRFEVMAEVPDGTGDGDRGGRRLSETAGRGRCPEQERRRAQRGGYGPTEPGAWRQGGGCDLLGDWRCEGSRCSGSSPPSRDGAAGDGEVGALGRKASPVAGRGRWPGAGSPGSYRPACARRALRAASPPPVRCGWRLRGCAR